MSAARKYSPVRRRHFQQSQTGRGLGLTCETLDFIPADTKLTPLRDQMILEPLDVEHSRVLIIPPHSSKLVRAKVLAIGPGHYPNRYDGPKGKRIKIMGGTTYRPTEVKAGDVVHLDGRQTGRAAFDAFYWGDKYCLHAREEDVAYVED